MQEHPSPPRPNKLRRAKLAQIEALRAEADVRLKELSDQEFLVAGLALYAAEGAKKDGDLTFCEHRPADDPFLLHLA